MHRAGVDPRGRGAVPPAAGGAARGRDRVVRHVAAGADPTFIDARTGWYGASILKAAPSFPGETTFDKLYVTHDGGANWSPLGTSSGFIGGRMDFMSSSVGWALSSLADLQFALLMTTDGGRSWQPLNAVVIG